MWRHTGRDGSVTDKHMKTIYMAPSSCLVILVSSWISWMQNHSKMDVTKTGTSKTQQVLWTKQQLCKCITLFCTFICRPYTTTTWNIRILSWLENRNSKVMKFAISLWNRTRPSLFSFPLSSNWVKRRQGTDRSDLVSIVRLQNVKLTMELMKCFENWDLFLTTTTTTKHLLLFGSQRQHFKRAYRIII